MKAQKLYQKLENDFITPEMSDQWAEEMKPVENYLCENFKARSMGLVCDFTAEISRVYTAVFPTDLVLQKILTDNVSNAMLFVHHPQIWDIRQENPFGQMNSKLLEQFQTSKISIYNLHVPLDNYGPYSTSVCLANALDIKPKKSFAHYFGAMCGVFGQTRLSSIMELKNKFQTAVGHEIKLYQYGEESINNGQIAVVAGGGLDETIAEVAANKINMLVTGITVKNEFTRQAHELAKKNHINILGGTHYSTEKFACIAMTNYFRQLDLPSEFIEGEPVLEDM